MPSQPQAPHPKKKTPLRVLIDSCKIAHVFFFVASTGLKNNAKSLCTAQIMPPPSIRQIFRLLLYSPQTTFAFVHQHSDFGAQIASTKQGL